MMTRGRQMAAGAVLLALLLAAPCHALTVLTEELPPLSSAATGAPTGFSVEIVSGILKRLGTTADIHVQPWARAYKTALETPDVVLFTVTRTPERESRFHWIGPLLVAHNGFYAPKGHGLKISGMSDARRVRAIATYRADARDQTLAALGFTNLDRSDSPDACLKKLMSGRVDLWLFDSLSLPAVAQRNGIPLDALELVAAYGHFDLYIAMSKGTPEATAARWQRALDAIKKDGTFARHAARWLPPDSTPRWVSAPSRLAYPRPVVTLYTENAPPGSYVDNGDIKGFSVALVRETLRRLALPDTIAIVPWARAYNLAQTTPGAAVFSTTRLALREPMFKWVGPLYSQQWGLYARKDRAIVIRDLQDARRIARIGTYRQDAKEQFLQELGFENLVSATTNAVNIRHLFDGSIDLWASSDFNMPYLVLQAGANPDDLVNVFTFQKVRNFIAFNRQTPASVITAWQQTLDDINSEGLYRRLYEELVWFKKRTIP